MELTAISSEIFLGYLEDESYHQCDRTAKKKEYN